MNLPNKPGVPILKGVEFEADQILQALKVIPTSVQTAQAFNQSNLSQKTTTNVVFSNNIEWHLPEPGPQSSGIQHFNRFVER